MLTQTNENKAGLSLLKLATIAVATLALTVGCSKKNKPGSGAEGNGPVTSEDVNAGLVDSDAGNAFGLRTVNFAYDSSALDAGAKETLLHNAQVLKDKSSVAVQIEGHTDERGGVQYNIALGERRANAARSFLLENGVDASRVSIISYGKERPVAQGHDEAAWAQNRRANFKVTQQ